MFARDIPSAHSGQSDQLYEEHLQDVLHLCKVHAQTKQETLNYTGSLRFQLFFPHNIHWE